MRRLLCLAIFCLITASSFARTVHLPLDFRDHWKKDKWQGQWIVDGDDNQMPVMHKTMLLNYREKLVSVAFRPRESRSPYRVELTKLPPHTVLRADQPGAAPHVAIPSEPVWASEVTQFGYHEAWITVVVAKKTSDGYAPLNGGELVIETNDQGDESLFRGLPADRAAVLADVSDETPLATYPQSKRQATSDYLAIAASDFIDDKHEDALSDLLAEKTARGVRVQTLSYEDIDTRYRGADRSAKVRQAIREAYLKDGIQYVLLVGDGQILAAPSITIDKAELDDKQVPSDMFFGCLDGDFKTQGELDLACEVAVGRAPVANLGEMHHFVRKTLQLQRLSGPDDFARKVLDVTEIVDFGSMTNGSIALDAVAKGFDWLGAHTLGFPARALVEAFYEERGAPWYREEILKKLNEDRFYVINHLGHCSEKECLKIQSNDLHKLTNDQPFFLFTQGCDDANLNKANWASKLISLSEHGAGALIANTREGFYRPQSAMGESNLFAMTFYDGLSREGIRPLGKLLNRAKKQMIYLGQLNPYQLWVNLETVLFGDPELALKL